MNSPARTPSTIGSDSAVIQLAQQGDSNAFATLFNTHKARIYSLCLRMTNNVAEAEDLTQEAFLHAFRKLSTFRGESALSTWLHRIAVNTVLMHFRKKWPCQFSLDAPRSNNDEEAKPARREPGIADGRLEGSVDRVALARAISTLSDGYRTIFLLHEVEGYQHREIAELLGCSVGTSKSQLHKAKLRIRELLADPMPISCRQSGAALHRVAPFAPKIESWPLPASARSNLGLVRPMAQPNG
ncbi:MAG: sigma-70 family RNA polymerase sigma factor [Terriglobales bacterium]